MRAFDFSNIEKEPAIQLGEYDFSEEKRYPLSESVVTTNSEGIMIRTSPLGALTTHSKAGLTEIDLMRLMYLNTYNEPLFSPELNQRINQDCTAPEFLKEYTAHDSMKRLFAQGLVQRVDAYYHSVERLLGYDKEYPTNQPQYMPSDLGRKVLEFAAEELNNLKNNK